MSGARFRRALSSPRCAYLGIVALQLKVMWGAWLYRDLPWGDTSGNYVIATWWADSLKVNLVWSPLYTAFYGTVLAALGDAYAATIAHRLFIAVAASLLMLALMRRLLPAWVAWLVAAWWATLPINFDTVYEVHLFGVLPLLAAFWVVAAVPGRRGIGLGLGLLLLATLLVRHETVFPFMVLTTLYVLQDLRRAPARIHRSRIFAAYALPIAASLALAGFFHARAHLKFPQLWHAYGPRHTVNMCQAFATGYQQRHPEWTKSPWTECTELMHTQFGTPEPSLTQMVRANPRAVLEHFAWNARLTPNGLQVMLFNAMWGRMNPDYLPVRSGSVSALVLSLLAVAVLVAAAAIVWSEVRWRRWLRRRARPWFFMVGTVATLAGIIILTQRPRPSYLFSVTAVIMGALGLAVAVILRWAFGKRRSGWFTVACAVALLALVPSHYASGVPDQRELLRIYRRTSPAADLIAREDSVVMIRNYALDIARYVGRAKGRSAEYPLLRETTDAELLEALRSAGVNVFYVDEQLLAQLDPASLFVGRRLRAERAGWQLIGLGEEAGGGWRLWARTSLVEAARGRPAVPQVPQETR